MNIVQDSSFEYHCEYEYELNLCSQKVTLFINMLIGVDKSLNFGQPSYKQIPYTVVKCCLSFPLGLV